LKRGKGERVGLMKFEKSGAKRFGWQAQPKASANCWSVKRKAQH